MIVALVIVGVVELIAITVLLILAAAAPMGWQDENGFHYGLEPGTDARVSFDRLGVYGDGELR